MRVIVQLEQGKGRKIKRLKEDRDQNPGLVRKSDGGYRRMEKVRGIERHRHMFNRKGEMTYVIT